MRLFYLLSLAVLMAVLVVFAYDLFQAEIEKESGSPRFLYDPRTNEFTFQKPQRLLRIVYASMFGPGEPVMRVRDKWIGEFEREYAELLSERATRALSDEETRRFIADCLERLEGTAQGARRRWQQIEAVRDEDSSSKLAEGLLAWLERRQVSVKQSASGEVLPTGRKELVGKLVESLLALVNDKSAYDRVRVEARQRVEVERRWQGRWVLSANRPRFLTGREVPDIIVGSKMELVALVEDDYAVALDEPLPGETVSPLDSPDTYGKPSRRWRDAFIPTMLEEGTYPFIADARRQQRGAVRLWGGLACGQAI